MHPCETTPIGIEYTLENNADIFCIRSVIPNHVSFFSFVSVVFFLENYTTDGRDVETVVRRTELRFWYIAR